MYFGMLIALMLIFPMASIALEVFVQGKRSPIPPLAVG